MPQGRADVSAHLAGNAALAQDMADQCCGRRLSVRARYADRWTLQIPGREFEFANHRDAALARVHEFRNIRGNAGRNHDQVATFEQRRRLQAESRADTLQRGSGVT